MLIMPIEEFDADRLVDELLDGGGAVRIPGLYRAEQVAAAREVIESLTGADEMTGSHFNQDEASARLQRRVWNLFADQRRSSAAFNLSMSGEPSTTRLWVAT